MHWAIPFRDGPLEKCWEGGGGQNNKKIYSQKKIRKKNLSSLSAKKNSLLGR
jgi:hypothetical protein